MLKALFEVISKAGANMGESSRTAVLSLIDMDTDEHDDAMTTTNAKLLGALIKNVPQDVAGGLLRHRVMTTNLSHSSVLALNAVLLESPQTLLDSPLAEDLPSLLCQGMVSKNVSKLGDMVVQQMLIFGRPDLHCRQLYSCHGKIPPDGPPEIFRAYEGHI